MGRVILRGAARGVAFFFGAFTLLNLLGEALQPGFDATIWWVNLRPLPPWAAFCVLLAAAALLLTVAVRGEIRSRPLRIVFLMTTLTLVLAAVRDAVSFYRLLADSAIGSSFPAAFSVFVGFSLVLVVVGTRARGEGAFISGEGQTFGRGECGVGRPAHNNAAGNSASGRLEKFALVSALAVWMAGFPLLQIHCFGWTDYRREADVAVVFGCRVYRSGKLSPPLADRVRSACQLYERGLVRCLIMSGGPGMGGVHETDAMRRYAIDLGVPAEKILVDREGLSTKATVQNTVPLIRQHGFRRVLAVSNYYHLPRIKLCFQRAGQQVFTVPSRHQFGPRLRSYQLAREVVALWAYYLEPLT